VERRHLVNGGLVEHGGETVLKIREVDGSATRTGEELIHIALARAACPTAT
jgi:hypothetical protein